MSRTDRPIRHRNPCKHPGCEGWAWAQGYCDPHYQKLKREGVIQKQRIMKNDLARFHTKYLVNEATGCWEWIGPMHPHGYGQFGVWREGKTYRAHRFAYERMVGPIPEGMLVRHSCDNKRCVYPGHLLLGTDEDNVRDSLERGRHSSQRGTGGSKITAAMARNIRVMYARGLPAAYANERNHFSLMDLSRIYCVQEETIRQIVKGIAHQDVG